MQRLHLDTNQITDWPSFHNGFAALFQFPGCYGRNMDAWIDCMSDVIAATTVLLDLKDAEQFRRRLPEVFEALVDCTGLREPAVPLRGVRQPPVPRVSLRTSAEGDWAASDIRGDTATLSRG